MRKKLIVLVVVLAVLMGFSGFYVINGTKAYIRYQQSDPATQRYCGDQASVHICVRAPAAVFSAFYPSYLASHHPLFFVEFSTSTPMTLVITTSIIGLSELETHLVNATNSTQVVGFIPALKDDGQVLRGFIHEVNTGLHVQVSDTAKHTYYINDIALALHSRWLMQWMGANRLKIAAWVTPDDRDVIDLVTRMATKHLQEQRQPTALDMVGYVKATPQQVIDQVDAIYDAMQQDYHLKYVQETVPYNGSDSDAVSTEYIRLPAEVLQEKSGMCIELTTLLASAVERIGLHAEIIIIPGHAFLGVAVTPDSKHMEFWDPAEMGRSVAAESANLWTDNLYATNVKQHALVDVISISDARSAGVGPML